MANVCKKHWLFFWQQNITKTLSFLKKQNHLTTYFCAAWSNAAFIRRKASLRYCFTNVTFYENLLENFIDGG